MRTRGGCAVLRSGIRRALPGFPSFPCFLGSILWTCLICPTPPCAVRPVCAYECHQQMRREVSGRASPVRDVCSCIPMRSCHPMFHACLGSPGHDRTGHPPPPTCGHPPLPTRRRQPPQHLIPPGHGRAAIAVARRRRNARGRNPACLPAPCWQSEEKMNKISVPSCWTEYWIDGHDCSFATSSPRCRGYALPLGCGCRIPSAAAAGREEKGPGCGASGAAADASRRLCAGDLAIF